MKKETRECWILFIGVVAMVAVFTLPIYSRRLHINTERAEKKADLRIAEHKAEKDADIRIKNIEIKCKNAEIECLKQAITVTLNHAKSLIGG